MVGRLMGAKMKGLLLACVFAGMISTEAFAADAAVEELPEPIADVRPGFSWTGGYIGIQGGWQGATVSEVERTTVTGEPSGYTQGYAVDGLVVGGHIGYNWQFNQFVIGAEGDFEVSALDGGYMLENNDFTLTEGIGTNFKQNGQASIRARLGFVPMEQLLIYATGGVAVTNATVTHLNVDAAESFDVTKTGWTVGGGAEYALTDSLTARLEYRYADFGKVSTNSLVVFPGITYDADLQFHSVRVGLSYQF